MFVTRFTDVLVTHVDKHFGCEVKRLQRADVTGPTSFTVSLTRFKPFGGAEADISLFEKVYVVLEGELIVRTGGHESTLRKLDSCCIRPNEYRSVMNEGTEDAVVLVVISTR